MTNAAVLGAGSWGTTLAVHLARVGHGVHLWGRDAALVAGMAARRVNDVYLPGITLPEAVSPVASLEEAVREASFVIAATPSHGTRDVIRQVAPFLHQQTSIVSATKGLETESLRRMSEVIASELGPAHPVVVLSGPSFALEVARELPTAVVVASHDSAAIEQIQRELKSSYFRLYGSDDVVGVELGGALKNIIAIAAGVVETLGLGRNALAALITRGLAEMSRLACAAGGRRETSAGLSGLGDLVLTCTGELSRNRRVGVELAKGMPLADIVGGMKMVAEGVKTTRAALALAHGYGVELPIASQVSALLEGRIDPRGALEALMVRRQRTEVDADR